MDQHTPRDPDMNKVHIVFLKSSCQFQLNKLIYSELRVVGYQSQTQHLQNATTLTTQSSDPHVRSYASQFAVSMHNFLAMSFSVLYSGMYKVLKHVADMGNFSWVHSGFPITLILAQWKYRESVMKKRRFWSSPTGRPRAHASNRFCMLHIHVTCQHCGSFRRLAQQRHGEFIKCSGL